MKHTHVPRGPYSHSLHVFLPTLYLIWNQMFMSLYWEKTSTGELNVPRNIEHLQNILKYVLICWHNVFPKADHNPRASWREATQAEDMMRAAYDMQVDKIMNFGEQF